jgi:acyl-CoA reductase-like NAD-dependent aldehyde dehydrogenase
MQTFAMTIGGETAPADAHFDVINPATGLVFAQAPAYSPEQLEETVQAAHAAFLTWQQDEGFRRERLVACAQALVANAERLGALVTSEQGKPLAEAVADVHRSADWFRYYASLELTPEVLSDTEEGYIEVVRRPFGVVAGIVPWNQPMLLAAWKAAPALLAGNTIILKPSTFTPLTALAVAEVLAPVLPAGVLSVVTGPSPLGDRLAAHPLVRKVSFTGSTNVGKQVAAAAATDLKRITLELGGNDAAIVLNDMEPDQIAGDLFWGAFKNNGQMCALIKRLYVPQKRLNDYVEAISAVARAVTVGDGTAEGVQLGPLTTPSQFSYIKELAAASIAGGAFAAAGGKALDRPGYFFEPTVLTGVTDGDRIVDEEQFGPILPIIPYSDEDDAVARANASMYGLGGSVWGTDTEHALAIARRLESGQASVNHHTRGIKPHLPFGGFKWSGIGVENGPWGYEAYTQLQTLAAPPRGK